MVVAVVDVILPDSTSSQATSVTRVADVFRPLSSSIPTAVVAQVVEVPSGVTVLNAVVGYTAPVGPYDGQIWIDLNG